MTPKKTIGIIDQWKKIETGRYQLQAFINAGGDPDTLGSAEATKKAELKMGEFMW